MSLNPADFACCSDAHILEIIGEPLEVCAEYSAGLGYNVAWRDPSGTWTNQWFSTFGQAEGAIRETLTRADRFDFLKQTF